MIVNAIARRVRFDRLRVGEVAVGDGTIMLDGDGILFTTGTNDPPSALSGKARLSAVNGALRRCYNTGAWQDV